ncbi:MAG: DUF1501 domain-containing protein, partial [Pirellula sp.]
MALSKTKQTHTRRDWLQTAAASAAGLTIPALLEPTRLLANGGQARSGVNCIFIWTQGGTSHHDTFDPKPLASDGVRGPLSVIETAIPGVHFTELCPRMAKEVNRFSLLRSWNPKNAGHGVADHWCMSGRNINPSLIYPCVGSVVSHQLGFKSALPPFIQLGANVDRSFQGGLPGVLGLEHAAFEIHAEANVDRFSVRDITPPMNMELTRIDRRRELLDKIDRMQRTADKQPEAFDALDEHYKTAFRMITAPETKQAFDIASETEAIRNDYGRSSFGQR